MAPDASTAADRISRANGKPTAKARPGLSFARTFSSPDVNPYDQVTWRKSTAAIKDEAGKVIFSQEVEAPDTWSDQAVRVVASKYFYGDVAGGTDPARGGRESSVRQLVGRVAGTIAGWGRDDGYFASDEDAKTFEDELAWLLLNQHGSFNSPVWFNVGLSAAYGIVGAANGWRWDPETDSIIRTEDIFANPQGSACFLQSIKDDMESIGDLVKSEMILFKGGSGTGTDLSPLRSSKEKLSGGGAPSGPVSFMKVYDAAAGVIKSGGRTRRSAKMQILRCDHPDIVEFVECKANEEKKARALIAAGYDSSFNGEAYASICFQNANLSVSATDEFMEKAGREYAFDGQRDFGLIAVTTGKAIETIDARVLLDKISAATHGSGDPGMFFVDTINRWHTSPADGPITTANPCGEYVYVNDSACNLASLNLMKFRRPDGTFDFDRFQAACRVFITAQEILVDRASYPTEKIARNSHRLRPLGLGYCGLGGLLMTAGMPYDSEDGRTLASLVTSLMTAKAYLTSIELAQARGPFEGYAANRESFLNVMGMHRAADRAVHVGHGMPEYFSAIQGECWRLWNDVERFGATFGFRNGQVSLVAPTGTIAFMMDSGHSTGLEPSIALVQYKTLAGRGMLKIVNPDVKTALETLGYDDLDIARIVKHIEDHDTIETVELSGGHVGMYDHKSGLNPEHLPVFDCAFPAANGSRSIPWQGHIKMLAAIQPFISGSSSKTVNMPRDATVEDISGAYLMAWKLGVKDVAIYRDGSKESQPVSTSKATEKPEDAKIATREDVKDVYGEGLQAGLALARSESATPRRSRLPDTRPAVNHKLSVGGVEAYLTVGEFPDGRPGEVFVSMAKEGSTLGGLMDAWATAVSILLQYGIPVDVVVNKFAGGRFEPAGLTRNPAEIPFASSLIDYVARWLGMRYVAGYREANAPRSEPIGGAAGGGPVGDDGDDAAPAIHVGKPVPAGPTSTAAHGPLCGVCGGMTVPTGRCWTCAVCATSVGGCG